MLSETGIRNPLRYSFVKGPTVNLIIKMLKTVGCNAELHVYKKGTQNEYIRIDMFNSFGCDVGCVSHYDGDGVIGISDTHMQIYKNLQEKDTMFFFIDWTESKLYGVKLSNIRCGMDPETGKRNRWDWIMADGRYIANLIDRQGIAKTATIADVKKLKMVSTLQIDIPAADMKVYMDKKKEYKQ